MANYPRALPRDSGDGVMQEYPAPYVATNRAANQALIVSSIINLSQNSSSIEVGTPAGPGVVIRWIPLTETAGVSPFSSVISSGIGANYDHYVAPATVRRFVIPRETSGNAGGQAGSMNGLYQRIAIASASATAASVLTSEQ